MIRALLIEDEVLGRLALRQALRSHPDVEIVGECANGTEALAALPELRPDLIFLDVQMPGLDGFGLLEALPGDARPLIIFTTAHSRHALEAFEAQAMDYLLKPLDQGRFDQALEKARVQLRGRATAPGAAPLPKKAWLERLSLRRGERIHLLRTEDIDWIRAEGNYVEVHTEGSSYLHRESLSRLESELDPARFLRIHRSTLVNLDRVKELQPLFHGEFLVLLKDGTRLTLSRRFRDRAKQVLGLP